MVNGCYACHRSIHDPRNVGVDVSQKRRSSKGKSRNRTKRERATIPRLEGHGRIRVVIEPIFEGATPFGPEGRPGYYQATFILVVPGKQSFLEDVDFGSLIEQGDSLLRLDGYRQVQWIVGNERESAVTTFTANRQGQIGTAWLRLRADSFEAAASTAYYYSLT